MSTTYAVVELGYGDGNCEGCQGQAGISLQRWGLSGAALLLATSGYSPSLIPMAISPIELEDRFKIRRHSHQWDKLDLCTDNPHRMGPENLSSLCRQLVVARGPLVEVFA